MPSERLIAIPAVAISRRGVVKEESDHDPIYAEETVTVAGGVTTRTIKDPFGMVDHERLESSEKAVAFWEMRTVIGIANIRAKLAAIPEARRRELERKVVQNQRNRRHHKPYCQTCNNSRWVNDDDEGASYRCPACTTC